MEVETPMMQVILAVPLRRCIAHHNGGWISTCTCVSRAGTQLPPKRLVVVDENLRACIRNQP